MGVYIMLFMCLSFDNNHYVWAGKKFMNAKANGVIAFTKALVIDGLYCRGAEGLLGYWRER